MGKLLVLVNGLPGAGKSTTGRALARTLDARFLSKDTVKDALANCVDDAADLPELGGIAMDAIWALARATNSAVVVDSWWFAPRDREHARRGIARAAADRTVEVWCDATEPVARARYASRHRPSYYGDAQRLVTHWDIWARAAAPLGLTPVVTVDTTSPVDYVTLADRIELAAVQGTR
ncbi:AAA family ATPase [Nocardia spumae]|uniref:AAA family ATPase n=1 Tax=Nocardia spumae TaxID=2887190 RepID=UPI001D13CE0A|nr:AAA family ATPase [Nocardia spumae]